MDDSDIIQVKQGYKLRKNNKKDTAGSHHQEEKHTHTSFHDLPIFKADPNDVPNLRTTTEGCPYKAKETNGETKRFEKNMEHKKPVYPKRCFG